VHANGGAAVRGEGAAGYTLDVHLRNSSRSSGALPRTTSTVGGAAASSTSVSTMLSPGKRAVALAVVPPCRGALLHARESGLPAWRSALVATIRPRAACLAIGRSVVAVGVPRPLKPYLDAAAGCSSVFTGFSLCHLKPAYMFVTSHPPDARVATPSSDVTALWATSAAAIALWRSQHRRAQRITWHV